MHAWEAIQKTLEIIEVRINEDISTEELADAAALSFFYYQRLFSRLVKKSVQEYIKLRRFARACESLKNMDSRIIDTAVDYGFGSHEAFTRAFKAAYGITPTQYRKSDVRLNNFDKPDLMLNYTMIDLGVPLISDGLVLEINRKTLERPVNFLGVQDFVHIGGHFPSGEATGVNEPGEIWRRFGEVESKIPMKPNGRKIGVAHHGEAPKGTFAYFVGAEVETKTKADNLQAWALPKGDYLICGFEAESFEELVSVALNKAFKYIGIWQGKNNLKREGFGAEIYFNEQKEDGVFYMEIWAPWLEAQNKYHPEP